MFPGFFSCVARRDDAMRRRYGVDARRRFTSMKPALHERRSLSSYQRRIDYADDCARIDGCTFLCTFLFDSECPNGIERRSRFRFAASTLPAA
jgi:hypothetical protein